LKGEKQPNKTRNDEGKRRQNQGKKIKFLLKTKNAVTVTGESISKDKITREE
jgi:hypothetical protein